MSPPRCRAPSIGAAWRAGRLHPVARPRIEPAFGLARDDRPVTLRGPAAVKSLFVFANAAHNLIRMPKAFFFINRLARFGRNSNRAPDPAGILEPTPMCAL